MGTDAADVWVSYGSRNVCPEGKAKRATDKGRGRLQPCAEAGNDIFHFRGAGSGFARLPTHAKFMGPLCSPYGHLSIPGPESIGSSPVGQFKAVSLWWGSAYKGHILTPRSFYLSTCQASGMVQWEAGVSGNPQEGVKTGAFLGLL